MSDRRVKIPFPTPSSPLRDGSEIPVKESTERWTEVLLEDGTVLRVKPSVLSAIRIDGEYDADGNPAYSLKVAPTMTLTAPEHLKKATSAKPIQ